MVTLYPDLEFVAKTQALDAVAEPIKFRPFTSVGSVDIDRKLCPVRSLLQYLKATTTPHLSAGKDVRSCLFPIRLQNPMRSNAPRSRLGLLNS